MTPPTAGTGSSNGNPLVLHLGDEELVIRQRYETVSIANDLLIGTWFLIGSVLFFFSSLSYAGTWLFVLGSIEMLVRPAIRFAQRVHLQRFAPNGRPGAPGHDM